MADYSDHSIRPEPRPNKYNIIDLFSGPYCVACGASVPRALSMHKVHFEWHEAQEQALSEIDELIARVFEGSKGPIDKEDPHKFSEFEREVIRLLEQIAENTHPPTEASSQ